MRQAFHINEDGFPEITVSQTIEGDVSIRQGRGDITAADHKADEIMLQPDQARDLMAALKRVLKAIDSGEAA